MTKFERAYQGVKLLPPPSPAGMLLAITLASLSHCRSKVETHLFAPNAKPELTKGLYKLCTDLSSTSTCSTQVTYLSYTQNLVHVVLKISICIAIDHLKTATFEDHTIATLLSKHMYRFICTFE